MTWAPGYCVRTCVYSMHKTRAWRRGGLYPQAFPGRRAAREKKTAGPRSRPRAARPVVAARGRPRGRGSICRCGARPPRRKAPGRAGVTPSTPSARPFCGGLSAGTPGPPGTFANSEGIFGGTGVCTALCRDFEMKRRILNPEGFVSGTENNPRARAC